MSNFLFDTFGTAGAPDGTIWQASPSFQESGTIGDLICSGGNLTVTAPASGHTFRGGEMWPLTGAPQADYTVTCPVTVASGNSTSDLYIGARFATGTNFHGYYLLLSGHSNGTTVTAIDYSLVKRKDNGSDDFMGFAVGGTTSGRTATFVLSCVGSTISVTIDGSSVGSVTDTEITAAGAPYIGMDASFNSSGSQVGIFTVASISADTVGSGSTPFSSSACWFLPL